MVGDVHSDYSLYVRTARIVRILDVVGDVHSDCSLYVPVARIVRILDVVGDVQNDHSSSLPNSSGPGLGGGTRIQTVEGIQIEFMTKVGRAQLTCTMYQAQTMGEEYPRIVNTQLQTGYQHLFPNCGKTQKLGQVGRAGNTHK